MSMHCSGQPHKFKRVCAKGSIQIDSGPAEPAQDRVGAEDMLIVQAGLGWRHDLGLNEIEQVCVVLTLS